MHYTSCQTRIGSDLCRPTRPTPYTEARACASDNITTDCEYETRGRHSYSGVVRGADGCADAAVIDEEDRCKPNEASLERVDHIGVGLHHRRQLRAHDETKTR